MFCFLILFPYYRKSLSPCFWDNTTDVKTNKKFYFWSHLHTNVSVKFFNKEVNLFFSWAWPDISILDPFAIEVWKYIHYGRVSNLLRQYFNCNICMNMAIRIHLKIDRLKIGGLQQKCITGDFPQLLELPLLRTHIRVASRVFVKQLLVEYSQGI